MFKKYDHSHQMSYDLLYIDEQSFNDIPYSAEELSMRLKKNTHYNIYIQYIKDVPVGYIGLLEVQNPHYSGVWIDLIAVCKQYQNQGIAKHMLELVIKKFKNKGITLSTALVRENNVPSLCVFKKLGYEEEADAFKLLCLDKI